MEGEDDPAAAVGDRAIDRATPTAGAIATNPMTVAKAAKDAAALRACLRSVRASFRALPLNLRTMAPLQLSQAAYRAGHPRVWLPVRPLPRLEVTQRRWRYTGSPPMLLRSLPGQPPSSGVVCLVILAGPSSADLAVQDLLRRPHEVV